MALVVVNGASLYGLKNELLSQIAALLWSFQIISFIRFCRAYIIQCSIYSESARKPRSYASLKLCRVTTRAAESTKSAYSTIYAIFRLIPCILTIYNKKYRILTFCDKKYLNLRFCDKKFPILNFCDKK